MTIKLTTRRVDGKLVIEGRYLALKTFSQKEPSLPRKLWLSALFQNWRMRNVEH